MCECVRVCGYANVYMYACVCTYAYTHVFVYAFGRLALDKQAGWVRDVAGM